jgi:hypothetical protein
VNLLALRSWNANCPRSTLRNREAAPFFSSRSSAEASVACGVGASLFHKPWACIASIIALQAMG